MNHGLPVHAVFLDASKTFDKVQHTQLFEKLIRRGVLMCFVRSLKYRYSDETMRIKWGSHLSDPFHVSNGVRPGRTLLSRVLPGLDKEGF